MARFSEDTFVERLRGLFVTIEIFNLRVSPLEKLGYGIVALIVTAVAGALIALVVRSGKL